MVPEESATARGTSEVTTGALVLGVTFASHFASARGQLNLPLLVFLFKL